MGGRLREVRLYVEENDVVLYFKPAPVVERANIAIQWIKCTPTNTFYPLDRVIRYLNKQGLWINDRDV